MMQFTPKPFTPFQWLPGANGQSIGAALLRSKQGITFHRQRLTTPDDDFIDLDFSHVTGADSAITAATPLVLLIHGLEGSAQSRYMLETCRQLAQRGIRAVGINFRSCSGEMNRQARLYHSGETSDLHLVINWLRQQYPESPLATVGFSLGGNILLKYLGEQGEAAHNNLFAAVAVSPPFDLASGDRAMSQGWGKLYTRMFLRRLWRKIHLKYDLLQDKIDVPRALNARTFREFDDAATAPLHGFTSATDYYTQSSCGQFLPEIRLRTFILRALDDPFFGNSPIPHHSIADNNAITAHFTANGGHVGFMTDTREFWAEQQAANFIAAAAHYI